MTSKNGKRIRKVGMKPGFRQKLFNIHSAVRYLLQTEQCSKAYRYSFLVCREKGTLTPRVQLSSDHLFARQPAKLSMCTVLCAAKQYLPYAYAEITPAQCAYF